MFKSFRVKLQGVKTFIASGTVGAGGLAVVYYDAIVAAGVDIKSLLPSQIPVQWAGVIAVTLALLFGLLRTVTKSAPLQKHDA